VSPAAARTDRAGVRSDPARATLFETRDLVRIPLWAGLKLAFTVLPMRLIFRLARLKGRAAWLVSSRRGLTESRLGETFAASRPPGEIRRIARRHFESVEMLAVARCWPDVRGSAGPDSCPVEGLDNLRAALAGGKGAILLAVHFGYPMLIKPLLLAKGISTSMVGLPGPGSRTLLKRTRVGRFVWRTVLRLPSTRHSNIPAGVNLRPLMAALSRNEAVVMLADGRRGGMQVPVPVLGRPILMTPGVFTVSRTTGAPVLPAFLVDGDRRGPLRLEVLPPVEVPEGASSSDGLQRFVEIYETYIERYPHLWRWSTGHFENHERAAAATVPASVTRREHAAR
jgi:lauroyl/myristoyl acyltransferase